MESLVTFMATGPNDGWDGPWWIFPPLLFLFWLTVVGIVVWFLSRRRFRRDDSGFDAASGVLAERFARGDISNDEYTERLGQLRRAISEHRKESTR